MTGLKLFGCLLILLAGGTAAHLSVQAELRRLEILDGWIALLLYIRSRIDCFLTPQGEIFASLEYEQLVRCGGSRACTSFGALFHAAKGQLTAECQRLIGDLLKEIGSGYREEQVRACDYCIGALREQRVKQAQELPARVRVRIALSLSASLGAVILLW